MRTAANRDDDTMYRTDARSTAARAGPRNQLGPSARPV